MRSALKINFNLCPHWFNQWDLHFSKEMHINLLTLLILIIFVLLVIHLLHSVYYQVPMLSTASEFRIKWTSTYVYCKRALGLQFILRLSS